MSKFAARTTTLPPSGPTSAIQGIRTRTHEGGAGFVPDSKTELFLLAVTNLVNESTFYESAQARDERFERLVHEVTASDPSWVAAFVPWLRTEANMRSASIVMAAEYARAGGPNARGVIANACQRADEPAEMLAYWLARYGRKMPAAVKRGIADAATRLYSQQTIVKYDSSRSSVRPGDVIDLVHPKPRDAEQALVFRHLLDRRHKRPDPVLRDLRGLHDRQLDDPAVRSKVVELSAVADSMQWDAIAPDERLKWWKDHNRNLPELWTWEHLSGWFPGGMTAEAWESVIPQMGLMARTRNCRNFDQAGISRAMVDEVCKSMADPWQVRRSRQFPLRYLSAFAELSSVNYSRALEDAVQLSTANVPALSGKTLVMLDVSGSMQAAISGRSKVQRWQAAGVFGAALASRSDCTLVAYDNNPYPMDFPRGASVLKFALDLRNTGGGGTSTWECTKIMFDRENYDRIVVVTDEQTNGRSLSFPVPVYVWNVGGYDTVSIEPGPGRYILGGLTDAAFKLIPILEAGRSASWQTLFGGAA